jgi:hypothetical protein
MLYAVEMQLDESKANILLTLWGGQLEVVKRYLEKQDLDIHVKYATFTTPEDRSAPRSLLLELTDYDEYVHTINGKDADKPYSQIVCCLRIDFMLFPLHYLCC